MGHGVLNLSSNGKGTGTGLLNHHVKEGNKMVVMVDLDQKLFPSTASFGASLFFH